MREETPDQPDLDSLDVDLEALTHAYFRHVPADERGLHDEEELGAAVRHHLALASARPQGTAVVRVRTPKHGKRSVVEVVTDDMPFLVDSVGMALNDAGFDVLGIVHPQLLARRDIVGALQEMEFSTPVTAPVPAGWMRESWIHVDTDVIPADEHADLEQRLHKVLRDVREAVEDWPRMQHQLETIVAGLQDPAALNLQDVADDEVDLGREFLTWLADDHFTFLGYREYVLEGEGDDERLAAVPASGLGILRGDQLSSPSFGKLPPLVRAKAHEKHLLVLAKANSRSTVHRPVHLDYIGVKTFDASGEVRGEQRFLGLFSSGAYTESVARIPLLRQKAEAVRARAGFAPASHAAKALLDVIETYPRDELFQTDVEDLTRIAVSVMQSRERRQLRLFVRRDVYGRFLSCLVYLPRDRYNTAVRQRIARILSEQLGGGDVEFNVRLGESFSARVHFVVRPPEGEAIPEDIDVPALEALLADTARSWDEDLGTALIEEFGPEEGGSLKRGHSDAFPEAYKEDYDAQQAAADLRLLCGLGEEGLDVRVDPGEDPHQARLKLYRTGEPLILSRVLPVLASLGVDVLDERPYELEGLGRPAHIYDFGLRSERPLAAESLDEVRDAVAAVWAGQCDNDGFNALVLRAGLTWQQVSVLRAYVRYLRQGGLSYSQEYVEETLAGNVDLARHLVHLFEARFDPGSGEEVVSADDPARVKRIEELRQRISAALDDVAALDQDRILRSMLAAIEATLRTNHYQRDASGAPHSYLSLKLEPKRIPDLPDPRPTYEIFVHSPRVEGVHLRFGAVARGGLRWSDRRDDFRTEVLGLVKAQMVKNTVIVPVGAKGGFVCRQAPDPSDRQAWLDEGIACYTMFISALLDVTDNLVAGPEGRVVVPPARVVRHDGDDTYLVVAADKGTATFSDIANGVAADYGFWLGDAFASGGSVGYDHKAMGITARGAWVSVRRHFRERGIDCQTEDFTAVGIGDMSGDVFGNGMLCSEHTRLVAAFDHRDIFIDPAPDAASSYAERVRLFALPRSSWQDYDRSLISEGGGVWSRQSKSIPISAQVREALGLPDDVTKLAPTALMSAILKAPVDLLWNGGIGTYVKAESESHADAGDKSNDALRVNGAELRCACIGEGGNLGLTQRGRIEYAASGGPEGTGGAINTDFIDNSAGVDTSDHEVNIKILLDRVVADGRLDTEGRNTLLASMTDEVAELVLVDNYEQNLALANAEHNKVSLLHVHEDLMRHLERRGLLDRELEALPGRREVAGRLERREGLTGPELSVLLSYVKIVLADELLATDIAEDPLLRGDLYSYFPRAMRQEHRQAMDEHPLRTEIVVTQIVNHLVNGAGMTYLHRLGAETGSSVVELTRVNLVAREIFGSVGLQREIAAWDNRIDASVQTQMRLEVRTLVERVSRWLVANRKAPLDSEQVVDDFDVTVGRLLRALPQIMTGAELTAYETRRDRLVGQGVAEDLATRIAAMPPGYQLMGIVDTSLRHDWDAEEVARVHFTLGERLGLPLLVQRILALPREDRWQSMARASLRDDLHAVHAQLVAEIIAGTAPGTPEERIAAWQTEASEDLVERSLETLAEITSDEGADLARLSVGLKVVRGLLGA